MALHRTPVRLHWIVAVAPALVSIVTPSYNSEEYLEQTIQSVLDQDYPNLEYIVVDGGSTDRTLAILEKYKDRLRYLSEPDRGCADAVNKGFQMARGDILAWLAADDSYLPGAVSTAVRHLAEQSDAGVVYGEGWWIDEKGGRIERYPTLNFDVKQFERECFICQPAAFIRRGALEGGLDGDLRQSFDYDLWIRIARRHRMVKIGEYLANSRIHRRGMTLKVRREVFQTSMRVLHRHFGYVPFQWAFGYACYLVDGRDQFFEPLRPTLRGYLLSLPLGSWMNARRLPRYWREWWSEGWRGLKVRAARVPR